MKALMPAALAVKMRVLILCLPLLALYPTAPAWGAELLDNEYFSLNVPTGWSISPQEKQENTDLNVNITRDDGDCLININIMPYAGSIKELGAQVSQVLAASGITLGEQREVDGVYYRQLKRKGMNGVIYLGGDGQAAAMTTIYGSMKMQRAARALLAGMRLKKAAGLFPSFKK